MIIIGLIIGLYAQVRMIQILANNTDGNVVKVFAAIYLIVCSLLMVGLIAGS